MAETPSKWWIFTTLAQHPSFVEIEAVNGSAYATLPPEHKPDIRLDDEVTVDRVVMLVLPSPQNPEGGFTEIRIRLCPFWNTPSENDSGMPDFSKKEYRVPLQFIFRFLAQGPFAWVDYEDPKNLWLHDIVGKLYSPPSKIVLPTEQDVQHVQHVKDIPGALDVINSLRRQQGG
jgi:hypothetical protein